MTNYEKIKQELTIDELAEFIDMDNKISRKYQAMVCFDNDADINEDLECSKQMKCIDCIKEWLMKEVTHK